MQPEPQSSPEAAQRGAALPLVIIGGLGAPKAAARAYGLYFQRRGYRVSVAPQAPLNTGNIRSTAARLDEHVEAELRATGAPRVHLVGMSLGGLVGWYYLKCGSGAAKVARFVAVGSPLRGSPWGHLARWTLLGLLPAVRQVRPGSELMKQLERAPVPEGVRLHALGTEGDLMTPGGFWQVPGVQVERTEYGLFPLGHWMLFTHPGNLKRVWELLEAE